MTDRAEDRTPDTGHASQGGTGMSALEAAAALGLSERTIRRAIARDELPAVKRGGVYRIAADDLARYDTWRNVPLSLAPRRRPDPTHLVLLSGHPDTPTFDVPRPLTPLLGRERELEELRERLLDEEVQLVTLTGPGGVGKTSLAIEVATTLRDAFDDGSLVTVTIRDAAGAEIAVVPPGTPGRPVTAVRMAPGVSGFPGNAPGEGTPIS